MVLLANCIRSNKDPIKIPMISSECPFLPTGPALPCLRSLCANSSRPHPRRVGRCWECQFCGAINSWRIIMVPICLPFIRLNNVKQHFLVAKQGWIFEEVAGTCRNHIWLRSFVIRSNHSGPKLDGRVQILFKRLDLYSYLVCRTAPFCGTLEQHWHVLLKIPRGCQADPRFNGLFVCLQ